MLSLMNKCEILVEKSPVQNSDPHLLTHGRKLGRRKKKTMYFLVTMKIQLFGTRIVCLYFLL